jgi:U3 small nucleolar RNA-associated protein 11
LRAEDYNLKKKKISQLEEKVKERHPDEFAYGMLSKTQGKHGKGNKENLLGHDAVKLLKTQDAGYLRVALSRGRKEMKRLEEVVGSGIEDEDSGRKIVFGDPGAEKENVLRGKKRDARGAVPENLEGNEMNSTPVKNLHDAEMEDSNSSEGHDLPELTQASESATVRTASKETVPTRDRNRRDLQVLLRESRIKKLAALRKRQKEIMAAAAQLESQRDRMARTVGGVNKNGVRFKIRERKR